MTLKDDIMNLRCKMQPQDGELEHAYCVGHRDARHAAAELAAKREGELQATIAKALQALRIVKEELEFDDKYGCILGTGEPRSVDQAIRLVNEALKAAREAVK